MRAGLVMIFIRKQQAAYSNKLNYVNNNEVFMRYPVIIRRTLTGYSVDVPDLPGCIATGTTVEHARQMIAEAIEMHLDMIRRSGETIPTPSSSIEFSVNQESGEELCTWVEVESPEPVAP